MKIINNKIVSYLIIMIVLFSPTVSQATTIEDQYRTSLLSLIEALQKQIILLKAELDKRQVLQETSSDNLIEPEINGGILFKQVSVSEAWVVSGSEDLNKITNPKVKEYFSRVYEIFPTEYFNRLGQLAVFKESTSKLGIDAFVETVPPKNDKWSYVISDQVVYDEVDPQLVTHELGHILSYQTLIGVPMSAMSRCESYFKVYGCPASNMYIRHFTDRFWSNDDLDRAVELSHSYDLNNNLMKYYKAHKEDYVSEYAVSSPEEDFAESFVYYVFDLPVSGDLASSKVDFFDRYYPTRAIKEHINGKI